MALTTTWNASEYLKSEADIAVYLDMCLQEGGDDTAFLTYSLEVAARARLCLIDTERY